MSSTLKSSFSISSLIESPKASSDDSNISRDPIVTSASVPHLSPNDRPNQDHAWNSVYLTPHAMLSSINSGMSVYGYPMMPHLPGGDMTPPASPTQETITPGSPPRVPILRRHSPLANTTSPDTSTGSEGYSGSSSPDQQELRKNGRMNYSSAQVARLESVFQITPYPDSQLYESLSEELILPAKKLRVWFQNKRARNKRRGSDTRRTSLPPIYMPAMPSLPPSVPHYACMMPGVMMTQPSVMMTPPSSPTEMQMMQHKYFAFPVSTPVMLPAQPHYRTSAP